MKRKKYTIKNEPRNFGMEAPIGPDLGPPPDKITGQNPHPLKF